MRRSCLLLALAVVPALTGCGSGGIAPNRDGSLPLYLSPEIATGPWSFIGAPTPQSRAYSTPIAGFYGGLTAQDTTVSGYLNIASTDNPGNGQASQCLGVAGNPYGFGVGISTVFVHGHASAGHLVLDGVFGNSVLHLDAQLSADRRSIVSGAYQVTGACRTDAPVISGFASPPVTGRYAGTALSYTGRRYQLAGTLTQGTGIDQFGAVPVEGAFHFTGVGCDVTVTLRYASVDGSIGFFFGYSAANPYNDAIVSTEGEPTGTTLLLDDWGFSDPHCGDDYADYYNPGQLTRQ